MEEAKADVVGETATEEVAAEYDDVGGAVGEVVADNDAVAAQIEEITQNVETLEATTKAKEAGEAGEAGVSSSVPGDKDTNGADVEQGVVWTREEPAEKHGEKGPSSLARATAGISLSKTPRCGSRAPPDSTARTKTTRRRRDARRLIDHRALFRASFVSRSHRDRPDQVLSYDVRYLYFIRHPHHLLDRQGIAALCPSSRDSTEFADSAIAAFSGAFPASPVGYGSSTCSTCSCSCAGFPSCAGTPASPRSQPCPSPRWRAPRRCPTRRCRARRTWRGACAGRARARKTTGAAPWAPRTSSPAWRATR